MGSDVDQSSRLAERAKSLLVQWVHGFLNTCIKEIEIRRLDKKEGQSETDQERIERQHTTTDNFSSCRFSPQNLSPFYDSWDSSQIPSPPYSYVFRFIFFFYSMTSSLLSFCFTPSVGLPFLYLPSLTSLSPLFPFLLFLVVIFFRASEQFSSVLSFWQSERVQARMKLLSLISVIPWLLREKKRKSFPSILLFFKPVCSQQEYQSGRNTNIRQAEGIESRKYSKSVRVDATNIMLCFLLHPFLLGRDENWWCKKKIWWDGWGNEESPKRDGKKNLNTHYQNLTTEPTNEMVLSSSFSLVFSPNVFFPSSCLGW